MANVGFEFDKEGSGRSEHTGAEALLNGSNAWRQRDEYERPPVGNKGFSLPSLYISFGNNENPNAYQPPIDGYGLPAYGNPTVPYESGSYDTNAYGVQATYNDQPIQYGSPSVPSENARPIETGSGVQGTSTCENPRELQQQVSPLPSTEGAVAATSTQAGIEASHYGAPLNPGTGPVEYSSQGTDRLPGATYTGFEQNVPDTSDNPLGQLWHGISDAFGNNTLQDQVTKKVVSQLTPEQRQEYDKESAEIRSRGMLDTMAPLPPLSTPMHDMVNNQVQNVEKRIASQVQSQMSPSDVKELQSEWNEYNTPRPPVNPYGGPVGQYNPKPGPAIQEYWKQLGKATEKYVQQS